MTESVSGRRVLIAGATSASGQAAARSLIAAGARVIAVGHDRVKLDALAVLGAEVEACDLTDEGAVFALAQQIHARADRVDGVLHLVGGWRGGAGLAGQSEADFRFLERSLSAVRHVSRAFNADLQASASARTAIVSSTALARPLAGGANYAAVKAAAEAWMHACAQGFAKAARDAGEPLRAAAVIFRVTTLAGSESVLASAFADLWAQDPTNLNDQVIELRPPEVPES
jgi:NADP-dependent 3-hydroxy acid dehydrogenase YdfG